MLGVPSVYTLHDFWTLCGRFNLIDLQHLLADPDAACRIARAAQARALAEHAYDARARTILAHAGMRSAYAPQARGGGVCRDCAYGRPPPAAGAPGT